MFKINCNSIKVIYVIIHKGKVIFTDVHPQCQINYQVLSVYLDEQKFAPK